MKIRIVGGCGSGKTYIARQLAKRYGIPHVQTDNLVWDRSDDTKYPEATRDRMLNEIVGQSSWIIEGVHHKWGTIRYAEADYIFIIRAPLAVQNLRTLKRFVKTRLGLEACNYKQSLSNLREMFGWNRNFERDNMVNILALTETYLAKRYIVRRNTEIMDILPNGDEE
ncbi:AAA family ATPase [Paenibacillus albus]|uniref:DNA topology modulation protein FlaR n=1 Tax=Paenibacillus albus TaxID=2495582 RepID=A0A3Q8XAQ5_9BACL|nr:AAA family ATPase [Paenibacillus albus]AZN42727.1 hypothetical protein EJC50_25825 [Paenibacillus albus]